VVAPYSRLRCAALLVTRFGLDRSDSPSMETARVTGVAAKNETLRERCHARREVRRRSEVRDTTAEAEGRNGRSADAVKKSNANNEIEYLWKSCNALPSTARK
jgi:hypothetical protein